jgi:hypothetical protein
MSGMVECIAAQSDELRSKSTAEQGNIKFSRKHTGARHELPPLDAGLTGLTPERGLELVRDCNPELRFYRRRTISLLQRYQRFSLETGRLPSIVGREFFRATVTSYRSVTFEDRVIFVKDVEKVLRRLDDWDQQLIARVILQEHNYDKAAFFLHCSRKTIQRRLPEVLDLLSEYFLEVGLLVLLSPGQ